MAGTTADEPLEQAAPRTLATPGAAAAVRLYLLGGFLLLVGGEPVPESAWRRRKARGLV